VRTLAKTIDEVAKLQDIEPAIVPTVFNGGTRITGRIVNQAWEAHVPGLADHVLVATRGGPGETVLKVDGKTFQLPVRAGLVTIVPRGRDGTYRSPAAPVSNVFLTHERLLACAEQISDGRPVELMHRMVSEDQTLYMILELLSAEAERGAGASRLFIEQLLDLMCTHLLRAHSVFGVLNANTRRGLASWQVKRVTAYMRENLDKDIGLQELAELVNLSRFYFCSAFRRATGYTPHEWLTRLRIEDARRLLAIQSMPITDIALAVGYQTSSAFAAAFRRLMGISPREYRRRL
jgi:AraC family transcriptional regulator